MSKKTKFWIAGLVVVIVGIILAKVVSPQLTSEPFWQFGVFTAGVLVAVVGLFIIMFGLRKT
jgi:hypothetical protein